MHVGNIMKAADGVGRLRPAPGRTGGMRRDAARMAEFSCQGVFFADASYILWPSLASEAVFLRWTDALLQGALDYA